MGIEGERRSLVKNEGMGRGRGREGEKPNEAKSFKLQVCLTCFGKYAIVCLALEFENKYI